MLTSCNFPPDSVSTWESNNEIFGSKYKRYYKEVEDRLLTAGKVFIFGDPGMGKTTILLRLSQELKGLGKYSVIYMDLSSEKSFVDEFWFYVKNSGIIQAISNAVFERRREAGYGFMNLLKKDFRTWMKTQCKKGSTNSLVRLYSLNFPECNSYQGLDGIILFLKDLKLLGAEPVLLMDEARPEHYYPYIHKLVNSGDARLVTASPTAVLEKIKDEATIRRIKENWVQLEPVTLNDAREILSSMCPEIGKYLVEEVYENNMTIAQLISGAKRLYERLQYECKRDFTCIEEKAKNLDRFPEIQEASKKVEVIVRECINQEKETLNIDRVFDKGKKVRGNKSNRNIDVAFISRGLLFLGDVKLTNSEEIRSNSIENVLDIITEREQEIEGRKYTVGSVFIITNGKVFDFPGDVIYLPNRLLREAMNRGTCTDELRKELSKKINEILNRIAKTK
ncbi:hypothetical protein [Metallosphaera javensis (ex Sakai et al. 2022)]|uniref:hypothetical protein n=1 Tax=Metallosphaera javensis (ex Sakai et al. 2022) TaxID=2775498 RepID=UPI00258F96EE|nr:MAG: hypothetical protein MjAS7_0031 [Metallosphaera javensis (ex Sakai et al. 2022)]